MALDFGRTFPGERSIILAEQRREWRAGFAVVVLVTGATFASWLSLSAPQDASELADSVVPAADAAPLFAEQPAPLSLHNGAVPIEAAEQTQQTPQADAPLAEGDIMKLQAKLKSLGFDPGKADGKAGPRTLKALNAYRKSLGLEATNAVDRKAVAPLTP